jgi:hypothetical protein
MIFGQRLVVVWTSCLFLVNSINAVVLVLGSKGDVNVFECAGSSER